MEGRRGRKIWFVESQKDERETVSVTLEEGRTLPISIHPGQIVPLLDRVQIADQVYLTGGALITGNELMNGELTFLSQRIVDSVRSLNWNWEQKRHLTQGI